MTFDTGFPPGRTWIFEQTAQSGGGYWYDVGAGRIDEEGRDIGNTPESNFEKFHRAHHHVSTTTSQIARSPVAAVFPLRYSDKIDKIEGEGETPHGAHMGVSAPRSKKPGRMGYWLDTIGTGGKKRRRKDCPSTFMDPHAGGGFQRHRYHLSRTGINRQPGPLPPIGTAKAKRSEPEGEADEDEDAGCLDRRRRHRRLSRYRRTG